MLLTKQRIYRLIIKKQIEKKTLIISEKRASSSSSWGSFFLKIKIERKWKLHSFLKEKITLKYLKIVRSSDPRVRI